MPRDGSVICDECGVVISRKPDLKRHKESHAPNKETLKYPCKFEGCGKAFLQYGNLKTHVNTHTGRKPHRCPDCAARFGDPSSLIQHRKRMHSYVPTPRAKFQGVAPISKNEQELTKESLCTASSSSLGEDSDADEHDDSETLDEESSEDDSSATDTDADSQAVDDEETHHPTAGSGGLPTEESHDCDQDLTSVTSDSEVDDESN